MAKMVKVKAFISDAVSGAFSIVEELAGEMREAFDNTPESLQNSGVGEARGEAADNLENISEVDVPERFTNEEWSVTWVEYPSGKRGLSRSKRRDNAVAAMDAVIARLDEVIDDSTDEARVSDAETLRDDLENAKSELEAVEFPGMYG